MRKWIKRLAVFLAVIVFLIIALILFLHTPWGKSIVRNQVRKYLVNQLKTPVEIGSIDYRLPAWIQIKELLVLDKGKDTLLYSGNVYVRIPMLKLINANIEVHSLKLDDIVLNVNRESNDENFNFQFITDAFSGATDTNKSTDTLAGSDPLKLMVGLVSLNNIRIKFQDKKEKQYYSLQLGTLFCLPDRISLDKSDFQIRELYTGNCIITMIDSARTVPAASGHNENSPYEPPSLFLALRKMGIRNFQFAYAKPLDKFDFNVNLDTLQLDQSSIDLAKQTFAGQRFLLHNSSVNLNTWIKESKASNEKELIQKTAEATGWSASLDFLDLYNNSINYHNNSLKPAKGLDYNHLEVKRLNFRSSQIKLNGNKFSAQIDSCSLFANNKYNLRGLRTNASYSDSLLLIRDLEIGLNQTELITQGDLAWEFKSQKGPRKGKFDCKIQRSNISYADLLAIQPELAKDLPINLPPKGSLTFSGNLKGSLNDFNLQQIKINSKELAFQGDASLHLAKEEFQVRIDQLKAQKNVLSASVLAQLQEQNILLPENIVATGKAHGTFNKVYTDLKLSSEFGEMAIVGDAGNFNQPQNLQYNLALDLNDMETGKWIGMDSLLGRINGQIVVRGSGIEPSKMNGSADLKINSFTLNGYNYSNVNISGQLSESTYFINGNINDSNLIVGLNLNGNIAETYPSVKGTVDIEKADFNKMGFLKDTIILSTHLKIDAPNTDPNNLDAEIFADSNVFVINGKTTVSDSVLLRAKSNDNSSEVHVQSRILTANLNTNYSLTMIGEEFINISNRIYPPIDSVIQPSTAGRLTELEASLNDHDLIKIFVPGLELKEPILINAKYNSSSTDSFLMFKSDASSIYYNNIRFDQLNVRANNMEDTIQLAVSANNIHTSSDTVFRPSVNASLKNRLIELSLQTEDRKGKQDYSIKASLESGKETTSFRILDDLTLNYSKWKVPKDNLVQIQKDGYIFQNFSLENRFQSVHITTQDPQSISPITVRIDSFQIADLLAIISFNDTALVSGNLSTAIEIQQPIKEFPVFTGNLGIKDLAFQKTRIGDLELNSKSVSDKLELDGKLKGSTDLDISGSIDPFKNDLDLKAQIQKLDMNLVHAFASDFITRSSGNLSGEIRVTGSSSDPHYNGYISFDTTTFTLAELNTPYRINKQRMEIEYPNISFNSFSLSDTIGNNLTLDGKINVDDFSEIGLNLKAKSKDFIALDATRRAESILYGKAILDIDLDIKGTSNAPEIEGKGSVKGKSDIHFIMSDSKNDYTNTEKGMIHFVDLDTLPSPEDQLIKNELDTIKVKKTFKGLKYNLNLEVGKDATFSILIDPATGDELVIKGEANLNTGIAENGMMGITGTYQLHSGHYNMNTKFLKGKFLLVDGSTITFSGDPSNAEANVITEYDIQASPAGLLRPAEEEAYNTSKRLPFVIVLTIKGPISAPELAFDIKLKEGETGINSSLKSDVEEQLYLLRNDVSAMNQQVFSLLVMNQFTVYTTGDLASSNLSPDVALKQGMSQFLMQGMNEIAGNLIKGVDINVNMESYKTNDSKSRTDVGFEVSKDMLDDRLTVTVGKNFTMGETNDNYQNSASQYIPDITTAYKLSRDGRYQVKAYRTNEYDAVVQGYFTETGVAFTIQLEYNLFKQIFQSQKKLQKE